MIVRPGLVSVQIYNVSTHYNKPVIFCNGCFDILHIGHVRLFEMAKSLGGYVLVALNSDESVKRLKGDARPVNNLDARLSVINALRNVDFVTWFEEDTPLGLITKIKPKYIVKGGGYKAEDVVGYKEAKLWGGEVKIFSSGHDISTTSILEAYE